MKGQVKLVQSNTETKMVSIVKRRRKNGSTAWLAQITIKKDKRVVVRENKTFDRRSVAAAWIEDREAKFARFGRCDL